MFIIVVHVHPLPSRIFAILSDLHPLSPMIVSLFLNPSLTILGGILIQHAPITTTALSGTGLATDLP